MAELFVGSHSVLMINLDNVKYARAAGPGPQTEVVVHFTDGTTLDLDGQNGDMLRAIWRGNAHYSVTGSTKPDTKEAYWMEGKDTHGRDSDVVVYISGPSDGDWCYVDGPSTPRTLVRRAALYDHPGDLVHARIQRDKKT